MEYDSAPKSDEYAPGGDHSKCIKSDRSRHKSYGIIRVEFINQIGINELTDKRKTDSQT